MSRMSDAAKNNERRGQTWLRGGARGIRGNPATVKAMTCRTCHHAPCTNGEDCRRARGETTAKMRRESRRTASIARSLEMVKKNAKKAEKAKKKLARKEARAKKKADKLRRKGK